MNLVAPMTFVLISLTSVSSLFQACNPKYPDYDKTGSICVSENINNTLTRYRWLVSAPTGRDGVTSPMREADFDTFFTSSKLITLDSVYFQAGSRVQCAARAVNSNGDEGLELSSPIVSISTEEGEFSPYLNFSYFISFMELPQYNKRLLNHFVSHYHSVSPSFLLTLRILNCLWRNIWEFYMVFMCVCRNVSSSCCRHSGGRALLCQVEVQRS